MMNEMMAPQQLAKEGQAAYQRREFEPAARAFDAARKGYSTKGDRLAAAEAANNASVAFLQAGDAPAAFQAVEGTAEVFAAAGDIRRQALALGNRAAALEALGRLDEAAEGYQHSADLLKQVGEDGLRANVMQSLSALQLRRGRQLEALATMQAGLEDVHRPTPKQWILKKLLQIPNRMLPK